MGCFPILLPAKKNYFKGKKFHKVKNLQNLRDKLS